MGRLGDTKYINAVGVGNVIVYIFGYSATFGLNGALNTFVS